MAATRPRPAARSIVVIAVLVATALLFGSSSALAADPCHPVVNPVACENTLPGDPPSDWQTNGAGDPSIQGFATSMSVNAGQTVHFKINTDATSYHFDILRLGYYQGNGARKLAADLRPSASLPQNQPACLTDSTTGLIDCGNWGESASWTVPATAVSGIYIAHLVRDDNGADSQILFVVRNDSSHSDMLVQTSDATWEAYNDYGGNSLYRCSVACPPGNPNGYKAAYAVSYNRPFDGAAIDGGASYFYYAEYQMVRFLESNGYDVSYTSSADVDAQGALLKNHKVFMSSGHDEYWSGGQRANVEAARAAGVNLAFFSGNEAFWKTRYAASIDGSNSSDRTLVSYKETHFDAPVDPKDPPTWTGTWRDPRFSPPADGGRPENALTGQYFAVNSGTADIVVPYQFSKLRLWRNTSVANLTPGQSLTLAPGTGTLGYEWDLDADNGFRPAGLFDLSSTTVSGTQIFTDYGTNTTIAPSTHHLTLYRSSSGALVFGAGTVQWAWGLDNTNAWSSSSTDPSGNPPDPNMQQATVNLFADMGVQPTTLISGLQSASKSTDTTPPTSAITSPTGGSTVSDGSQVTISGSASDGGGGVVAGVEVSVDGGKTWHPVSGTTNWSYTWTAHGSPSTTIISRAVDDSGNLESPSAGVSVNVTCPCGLWGSSVTPPDSGDGQSVEVGVKFTSDVLGTVTGLRFYKPSANTGTHVGSLWSASGQRLASATFSNETASGWQQVTFAAPVTISPNTTYVASYFAPAGHYAATPGYFYPPPSPPPNGGGSIDSPPLHAIANAASPNGVYVYSGSSTFPASSFGAANYWVDVMFTSTPPPGQVKNVTATAGFNSATVSWSAPSGGAPSTYTVTPYIGSTPQTPTTVTGSPPATTVTIRPLSQGTSYTFTVQASNANGSGPVSSQSNSVTPTGPTVPTSPGNVTATAATSSAQVSWSTPSDNGGSTITGYTITPYIGATAQSPIAVNNGSATSATLAGLNNGSSYTFTVSATNANGTSAASAPSNAVTPQNTIFDFGTPAAADAGDPSSVELGIKFKADSTGTVTGIRFYKAAANMGTHIGSLWTSTGTLLASATFTNETASGWQQVTFASPVAVTAGTTYVAGYFALNGHYSATSSGLASAVDNAPLHSIANGTSANGVYAYSGISTFPTNSYNATNYWVDVLYASSSPGQVTNVTATPGFGSATVKWSAPTTGGAVSSYTITPYIGSTAQTPTTISGAPPATTVTIKPLQQGTSYTFTVQASNSGGAGPVSSQSNAVTPTGATVPSAPQNVVASAARSAVQVSWAPPSDNNGSAISGYTVTPYVGTTAQTPVQVNNGSATSTTINNLVNGTAYTFTVAAANASGTGPASAASAPVTPQATVFDFSSPATVDAQDPSSVELGMKFTADTSGSVTGIRFYKAAANTGTHVGSLWSAGGTLLASATFTSEGASGWQQVTFANPVPITAGATYVAGYFAPNGHYSLTSTGLSSAVDNSPLHTVANSVSANGVYAYTASSTFPTSTYQAANYWVDLLFTATAPGQVTGVTATAGNASATVSWTAPAGGGVTSYIVTPYIGSTPQASTTVTGSPPATTVMVHPLTAGTSYTFTVQAANATGAGPASAPSNAVTPTSSTLPGAPGNVSATAATSSAMVSWTPPGSDGGSPITGYTITPYVGTAAQTPVPVSGGSATSAKVSGLVNGTGYTFTVSASNANGAGGPSAASNLVTPQDTIFDFATPATIDSGDPSSVELGIKFKSDVNGSVTGVRFYKAAANTGTHVAGLWTTSGTLLASATFANETASGWQQVLFSSAVPLTAGTTYVAGYFAPNGHYSFTSSGLSSAVDNPPLHSIADAVSPDGVYALGSSSSFPTNSFNATNYWVDVLFKTP